MEKLVLICMRNVIFQPHGTTHMSKNHVNVSLLTGAKPHLSAV